MQASHNIEDRSTYSLGHWQSTHHFTRYLQLHARSGRGPSLRDVVPPLTSEQVRPPPSAEKQESGITWQLAGKSRKGVCVCYLSLCMSMFVLPLPCTSLPGAAISDQIGLTGQAAATSTVTLYAWPLGPARPSPRSFLFLPSLSLG